MTTLSCFLRNTLLAVFVLSFTLTPFKLFALAPNGTIILNPENPSPYSTVELKLMSYSLDVDTSMITWISSGRILLSGIGEKKLNIKTGGVGETTAIQVTAKDDNGTVLEQEIKITPASVSLLYEATESYVPLFYEGRSLPSDGATVSFTAVPSISEGGKAVPAKSLSYSWYVNGSFVDKVSGYGKQRADIPLEILSESTEVKVIVKSQKGQTAEKTIQVYPHPVMPLLYTYDEILGTNYSKAIYKRFEAVKDFTIKLEPFYISNLGELSNSSIFTWLLDGSPITPLGGTLLSFQPKADSFGIKNLSINVSNSERRLQKGDVTVDLIFDTR